MNDLKVVLVFLGMITKRISAVMVIVFTLFVIPAYLGLLAFPFRPAKVGVADSPSGVPIHVFAVWAIMIFLIIVSLGVLLVAAFVVAILWAWLTDSWEQSKIRVKAKKKPDGTDGTLELEKEK